VEIRYYLDPSGEPHIYGHDVTEGEVEQVVWQPLERTPSRDGTFIASGRTLAGRYLKVVYKPDDERYTILVITAYDMPPRQVRALNRRSRRRRR